MHTSVYMTTTVHTLVLLSTHLHTITNSIKHWHIHYICSYHYDRYMLFCYTHTHRVHMYTKHTYAYTHEAHTHTHELYIWYTLMSKHFVRTHTHTHTTLHLKICYTDMPNIFIAVPISESFQWSLQICKGTRTWYSCACLCVRERERNYVRAHLLTSLRFKLTNEQPVIPPGNSNHWHRNVLVSVSADVVLIAEA